MANNGLEDVSADPNSFYTLRYCCNSTRSRYSLNTHLIGRIVLDAQAFNGATLMSAELLCTRPLYFGLCYSVTHLLS